MIAVVVALAVAGPAAAACTHPASLAALEGQVMCPTCKTTLDQSDAPAARRIEAQIRLRIRQCWTETQIKRELVDDFGESILAAPPKHGFGLLAWLLPLGGIVVAAALLALGAWRWTRAREPEPAPVDPRLNGKTPLDPELERRLDDELARFDG